MYFTREDILKIQRALLLIGIKDSEFREATLPLQELDIITVVQNGANRKVKVNDIIGLFNLLNRLDFINVSDTYDEHYITINEAIKLLPQRKRKEGLVITFQHTTGKWQIYQFKGTVNKFVDPSQWEDILGLEHQIIDSIVPDEEDLTMSKPNESGNSLLSLKDREYDPEGFSGMATKILRKRIVEVEGIKKNILYQDDFNLENCIYEIRYDFDLNAANITIPKSSILRFNGGSLSNGNVIGNDTIVLANNYEIFKRGYSRYRAYKASGKPSFEAKIIRKDYNYITLSGSWNNNIVKSKWCGLLNNSLEECSLAINNHITLYAKNAKIVVPKGIYIIYGKIECNLSVDFSDSTIKVIADYSQIYSSEIAIPTGTEESPLITLHGHIIFKSGCNTASNFTIDLLSQLREESFNSLGAPGVAGAILIDIDITNFILENVVIKNSIECAIFVNDQDTINAKFINVTMEDIGEHGIYEYAKRGTYYFKDCKFINLSCNLDVYNYRGSSSCIKVAALETEKNIYFEDCEFLPNTALWTCLNDVYLPHYLELKNCKTTNALYISDVSGDYSSKKIVFKSCTGIWVPFKINNNTVYYYDCTNMPLVWNNIYLAENTDFYFYGLANLSDKFNEEYLSKLNDTIKFIGCTFRASYISEIEYLSSRKLVIFDNCIFNIALSSSYSNYSFLNLGSLELLFNFCTINLGWLSLLKSNDTKITISNSIISTLKGEETSYIDMILGSNLTIYVLNTSLIERDKYNVGKRIVNLTSVTKLLLDLKVLGFNRYHLVWYATLASGESTYLSNTKYFSVGKLEDSDYLKYLTVTPVNSTESATFLINLPSDNNVEVIVNHTGNSAILLKFDFNFDKYPK